jgi:hypothetical protein
VNEIKLLAKENKACLFIDNRMVWAYDAQTSDELYRFLRLLSFEALSTAEGVKNSSRGDLRFTSSEPIVDRCW